MADKLLKSRLAQLIPSRPQSRPHHETVALGRLLSIIRPWVIVAGASAAMVVANTDFLAPPRFDGAGYAVLGQSLATGRGYSEIDHPEMPRHAHFPPGYPAALAIIWLVAGRSVAAAHLFSVVCTVAAVLLAWRWFCTIYPKKLALILALRWP